MGWEAPRQQVNTIRKSLLAIRSGIIEYDVCNAGLWQLGSGQGFGVLWGAASFGFGGGEQQDSVLLSCKTVVGGK